MNSHYNRFSEMERVAESVDESRRAFLAAVGVAVAGGALATQTTEASLPAVPTVGAPVLGPTDLTTPIGDAYIEWRVDPTTAPLLAHLGGAISSLNPALVPTSAFLARRGVDAPRYVETTAISAMHDARAVASAVDEWMVAAHGETPTTRTIPDGGVEWRVGRDSWTEAVTIRPAGDWFLLVSAGGRADAAFAPEAAAAHYARLLAGRLGRRA